MLASGSLRFLVWILGRLWHQNWHAARCYAGRFLPRRVVAHCVFATEACMIGGTFSSALLGSLLDDAIGVSAALSFPVVLAAIACLLMGLLAGSMHGWAF